MSRPTNKENLMSLADQLLWGMEQYGVSTELFGASAYVGFNEALEPKINYFLCDGTTDETQINLAIIYVNGLGGGTVHLERGAFDIDTSINMLSDVVFEGEGYDTTISTSNNITMITATTKTNMVLRDFRLTGTGAGANWAIDLITCTQCTIKQVYFDTLVYGAMFHTCTYSSIIGCHIVSGITQAGIWVNSGIGILALGNHVTSVNGIEFRITNDSIIDGNEVRDCGSDGIYLYGSCIGVVVSNNISESNAGYGIHHHSGGISYGLLFEGNTCRGNTQYGFGARNLQDSIINGNVFYQNGFHGIYLHISCDNNVISNNQCSGNDSGNTGTYDGIFIEDECHNNLIHGNNCRDNDRWGIMVDNDSDFNKVSDNYTSGNTAGSINVNGATCDGNQIEFNTVEEGAPVDTGTLTRSYGNFDPSANAFVGDVGVAPF